MPKGIRYSEEFKRDAVAQITERGYSVQEVSDRFVNAGVNIPQSPE